MYGNKKNNILHYTNFVEVNSDDLSRDITEETLAKVIAANYLLKSESELSQVQQGRCKISLFNQLSGFRV